MDQPIGTGFSYTSDEGDIRHDEEGISNDLYDFLQVIAIPLCYIEISFQQIITPHTHTDNYP